MIRRQFIKLATLTGATGLASVGTMRALESRGTQDNAHDLREVKTVTWRVAGFTCVTCAVGLETMLRKEKGVRNAEASYEAARVRIEFYPEEVSEEKLRSFITDIGFKAEEQKG